MIYLVFWDVAIALRLSVVINWSSLASPKPSLMLGDGGNIELCPTSAILLPILGLALELASMRDSCVKKKEAPPESLTCGVYAWT